MSGARSIKRGSRSARVALVTAFTLVHAAMPLASPAAAQSTPPAAPSTPPAAPSTPPTVQATVATEPVSAESATPSVDPTAALQALCATTPSTDPRPIARACAGVRRVSLDPAGAETDLQLALSFPDDADIVLHRAALLTELDAAGRRLATLEVRCDRPGASIALDGALQGLAPLARPIRATAGPHVVRCDAPDHDSAEAMPTLVAGTFSQVELAPVAHDHRPLLERTSNGDGQRALGYGALTLGGVALVVGGVGLGVAFANDLSSCTLMPMSAECTADRRGRDALLDAAVALTVTGTVLVVAGIVVALTAP